MTTESSSPVSFLGKIAKAHASGPHGSRADGVYKTLLSAIQNGQLTGGARLLEKDLVEVFGVSRTPVREALLRLQQRGLLATEGRQGLVVQQITEERLNELYAVREVLEGAAARFAAENASRRQIAKLRELLELIAASKRPTAQRRAANRDFHRTIFEAAQNDYLNRLLSDLYDEWALVGTPFHALDTKRLLDGYEEHCRVVDAIEAGDADDAEQAMRHHVRQSRNVRARFFSGARK